MKLKEESKLRMRTKIHDVMFYNVRPRAVQCLAYNKISKKLALSRNDSSIEIWDMQQVPLLERIIPKSPGGNVEAVAWAGERLFSVGLSGELVEWDLVKLEPRRMQHATGNAIWCMDVNSQGTELALGTEEGFINTFNIENDAMLYSNIFDKQSGRVLCCKYDSSGKLLVTGSIDVIRVWVVSTGHALQKMTLARAQKQKEVIIWSLLVLRDLQIISGDSQGEITVWDGNTGAQVESHQALKADVLALAVNETEDRLMCSGIEPIIRIYAKTKITHKDMEFHRWVKFLQRAVHNHDVKVLTCAGDTVLSGGIDGFLGVSAITKMTSVISRYGPFFKNPCAVVSPAQRMLLLRYFNFFELWQLEAPKRSANQTLTPSKACRLECGLPQKKLEFKPLNGEPIVCATYSPDGSWLCYATPTRVRLFNVTLPVTDASSLELTHIKHLPATANPSHMQFCTNSKRLFLASSRSSQIFLVAIGNPDSVLVQTIDTSKQLGDSITQLLVSECSKYIVAAGRDTIAVWKLAKNYAHLVNLPRHTMPITALAMHVHQPRVVAVFVDGKIFEYDVEALEFTCIDFCHKLESTETHSVRGILLDARNPNLYVLHNENDLFVLEKCPMPKDSSNPKKPKTDSLVANVRLKYRKERKHFVDLCRLSEDELVAVMVNPVGLVEELPDAFKQKKFGTD